jgi:hypothetical protein
MHGRDENSYCSENLYGRNNFEKLDVDLKLVIRSESSRK